MYTPLSASVFLTEVTEPNVYEFEACPGNRRLAMNAAWALDALSEHIYHEKFKGEFKNESDFKNHLSQQHISYRMTRAISTAAKHAELRDMKQPLSSSGQVTPVAATGWLSYFSGNGGHDEGNQIMVAGTAFPLTPFARQVSECLQILRGLTLLNDVKAAASPLPDQPL